MVVDQDPAFWISSLFQRGVMACFLVVVLGSFIMLIYSFIAGLDFALWLGILTSIFSGLGGYGYGVNRIK